MTVKRRGPIAKGRNGLVAALDVGTTKMACLIARADGAEPRIVGIGHHAAKGLRAGIIVDMDDAEASIRATVEAAERMAGENIGSVAVNLSGGHPQSKLIAYEIAIAGHEIGDADLRRILEPASAGAEQPPGRARLHAIPVGYTIDGHRGVRDPRGMFGERLGVNLHVVTAEAGAKRNLATCVARCHLDIDEVVISPYASALAALVKDEIQLGVTLIDMGGGTTSIAVFFDGELVHTESIPAGGALVTSDIAHGLSTPIAHAERIKTLYGSVLPSPSDDREMVKVPLIGEPAENETNQIPRSMLVGIVRPRIEEIFELVRSRLEAAGFDKVAGRRVVLTGGASQLAGVAEFAGTLLDKQVRLGRPRRLEGLVETASGPAFSTAAGLLAYAFKLNGATGGTYRPTEEPSGRFGRFGQWLREYF